MSFLDKLVDETRSVLGGIIRNAPSRDIRDALDRLERGLDNRAMEDIVYPVSQLYGSDAERATDREYDDMVKKYGEISAEAIVIQCLNEARLTRDLSRAEEDRYIQSLNMYGDIVSDAKRVGRRDDRDRDRGRDRDRDRDDSRRTRRDRDETNRHTNSFEREGDSTRRSSRNDSRKEVERTRREPVEIVEVETLKDGERITVDNFVLLPPLAKDVPIYFAGIEKLVYSEDKKLAVVEILEGDQIVNYEQHRTDIYLSPNRKPNNIAMSIEDLEKKTKEASLNRVKAFIEKEEGKEENFEDSPIRKITYSKSCVLDGIYSLQCRPQGAEFELREMLNEVIETPNFEEHVVAVTIEHLIDDLEGVDRLSEDYIEFLEITQRLSNETKLNDVHSALLLAQRIFSPTTYDTIYRLYNDAVCNALSASLKLGISTQSVLRDWKDIEKLVNGIYEENPQIVPIIDMNLCSALPTIFESEAKSGLSIYRNYIFLPVLQANFTIASPVRYATLNQSARPEMYAVVNKLLTTNVPQESFKALTTLVTLDNYSLPLVKNRGLLADSGYYVFSPIL